MPQPTTCSRTSTPSSARSPPRCGVRCASSPAPAPARPAPSRTASPTAWQPASTARRRCSPSPSPPVRPARCGRASARSAPPACRPARSTRRRCARPATSGRRSTAPSSPRSSSRSSAWSPTPRAGSASAPTQRSCATCRPRSNGPRSATSARPTTSRPPNATIARSPTSTRATVGSLMVAYEDVKRERGRIDMEDILLITAAILADDERVAAQVRRQYRWFVVDEFQDVNPLQSTLLDLWLGGRDDICVVGDPRQTIYTFAGASPADPHRLHPQVIRTPSASNWSATTAPRRRSSAVANAVFTARRRRRRAAAVPVRARRPGHAISATPTRRPRRAPSPTRSRLLHQRGMPWSRDGRAVPHQRPVRTVRGGVRRAEIPYTLRGVEGFFQRAEVRQAVALLRGAARGGQVDAGAAPRRGAARAREHGLHRRAAARRRRGPRPVGVAARPRLDGHRSRRGARPMADLTALVAELDRRAENAHAPVSRRRHAGDAARGQGPGVGRRVLRRRPRGHGADLHADTPHAIEEERRLFYVGVTRARRTLIISWAAARKPGGRGSRRPSRFLDPLLPADHEPARRPAPSRPQGARCRICKRRWRWRRAQARTL